MEEDNQLERDKENEKRKRRMRVNEKKSDCVHVYSRCGGWFVLLIRVVKTDI